MLHVKWVMQYSACVSQLLCVCVCTCLSKPHACKCPQEPETVVSPGPGVTPRWLWTAPLWVLGINPGPLQEHPEFLSPEPPTSYCTVSSRLVHVHLHWCFSIVTLCGHSVTSSWVQEHVVWFHFFAAVRDVNAIVRAHFLSGHIFSGQCVKVELMGRV